MSDNISPSSVELGSDLLTDSRHGPNEDLSIVPPLAWRQVLPITLSTQDDRRSDSLAVMSMTNDQKACFLLSAADPFSASSSIRKADCVGGTVVRSQYDPPTTDQCSWRQHSSYLDTKRSCDDMPAAPASLADNLLQIQDVQGHIACVEDARPVATLRVVPPEPTSCLFEVICIGNQFNTQCAIDIAHLAENLSVQSDEFVMVSTPTAATKSLVDTDLIAEEVPTAYHLAPEEFRYKVSQWLMGISEVETFL